MESDTEALRILSSSQAGAHLSSERHRLRIQPLYCPGHHRYRIQKPLQLESHRGPIYLFCWVLATRSAEVEVDGDIDNEYEGVTLVPFGTPECGGHRAGCYEPQVNTCKDSDASSSGEPDPTDRSSGDDTVFPGGRVRRMVKGVEKLRRVRRRMPFRRSPLQPMRMSHPGSIVAATKSAPIQMIRDHQGHFFQREIPCVSQALGLQCPIR